MKKIFNIIFILIIFCTLSCKHKRSGIPQILVFAKNLSSPETGNRVQALEKLGQKNGFNLRVTDTTLAFSDDSLQNYAAVVFLNCSAMPLNYLERIALERYIQAGGGFAGIHGLVSTLDWRWYGRLIAADSSLPAVFHDIDGGRAFYTRDTLNPERTASQDDLKKVLNGIEYAIGEYQPLDYTKARIGYPPTENHFTKHSLIQDTFFEPTEMTILPNLDILVIQRRGGILLYKKETGKIKQAGFLNVYWKANVKGVNAEEGMLGLSKDPAFSKNHWVYIYYSPIDSSVNRLSRFTLTNDSIDNSSEKVILEVKSQRQICCHTGGSIAFGPDSLLYFSAGDNSTPFNEPGARFVNNGFAPLNDWPGHEQYDAERSAGNTNDLRGKIMRIRVHDDGTYEIPKGNLFAPGTPKTRPEIYVMGNRNPYRISVDQKNSFLYWGEVGPDAGEESFGTRGTRGYDEINQARKAGYFGWPFFVGNNYAYNAFNNKNGEYGPAFNPQAPKNHSRNNTGLVDLPPAQPAFIWYPYAISPDFPDLGTGGRNAMAGPVYYTDLFPDSTRYPDYYNGKLFIYDWIRGWIKAVTLQPNGDFEQMEPFMEHTKLHNCIDMEVGPDGKLYLLEYGTGWFTKNADAGLSRIDYNASVASVAAVTETVTDSSSAAHGPFAAGYALTQVLDCKSCHKENGTSIGPSFQKVSAKYVKDKKAMEYLSNKVMKGGSGVWGDVAMSAHPDIARKDLKEIVQYILSLSKTNSTGKGK
ncbi:MAG: PQQ-dependent sugar dehydrogenase [Chitinophagales bacterium]